MTDDRRLINTDGKRLHHAPALDGFRGLGVLIVVFYHAEVLSWMAGSPILIDWFFIASGFLITMIVLDERGATGTNSLRRFYERRVLRLFPAMYAMIAAFTVAMILATSVSAKARADVGNWWMDALAATTYCYYLVAAFFPHKLTGAIGHTWSLSLEEQFYFIWPLILFFVLNRNRRRSDRTLIIGMVAMIAGAMSLRMWLHYVTLIGGPGQGVAEVNYVDVDHPTAAGIVYRIAAFRPDMIAYGCLLAFVYKYLPDPLPAKGRRTLGVLGTVGCATMFAYFFLGNRLLDLQILGRGVFELFGGPAYNVALLMMGPFILDLYMRPEGAIARFFSLAPLRWLGIRTYGIYLWHVLPILLFISAIQDSWGVRRLALGLIAGTLGVVPGILSFRYIERRFLALKETRFRRPQDQLATSVESGPSAPFNQAGADK